MKEFKSNKRAYYSLIIFVFLYIISLFAELIANDKPLLVFYKDELYYPIFSQYTDEQFGGFLETSADFKDFFTADEINANGFMIFPLISFNHDTINNEIAETFPSSPTWQNVVGTDSSGRDVAARLIYGFRLSVSFGLILTFMSSLIGISLGAVQGYYAGWVDLVFQRFIEIWSSLPQLYILIIFSSLLEPGFFVLLGILVLFSWVSLVGVVRVEFFRTRNLLYVKAAEAMGLSSRYIMAKHILPNAVVATFTFLPFILAGSITLLTALDYLGLGLPPGTPSLGELLYQGRVNLHAPWLALSAFFTLSVSLVLIIFIGEGVRDAFDPRRSSS